MMIYLREALGTICGYIIGLFMGLISALRMARIFHPRGILFEAKVESLRPEILSFYDNALVRLSSALWKKKEWTDILGLAIRFYHPKSKRLDQDLLFATFKYVWELPLKFFTSHHHNFLDNQYYSVLPFRMNPEVVCRFKVTAESIHNKSLKNREDQIIWAQRRHRANFKLWGSFNDGPWIAIAKIKLIKISDIDQEALAFSPFQNGLGIYPFGFLQHLRKGAYTMGQLARPRHHLKRDKENVSPSSPQYQGPWV